MTDAPLPTPGDRIVYRIFALESDAPMTAADVTDPDTPCALADTAGYDTGVVETVSTAIMADDGIDIIVRGDGGTSLIDPADIVADVTSDTDTDRDPAPDERSD